LTLSETAKHAHSAQRGTIVEVDGIQQPAHAPRLSRTPGRVDRPPAPIGQDTLDVLRDWGIPPARVQHLPRRATGRYRHQGRQGCCTPAVTKRPDRLPIASMLE
jgi:crotonobetainyl-CoA:carnitine CoA-transferase CaiB-like acyl-CoA transferase